MHEVSVRESLLSPKIKNSEGLDRILVEESEELWKPVSHLFKLIYTQNTLLEQWESCYYK